MNISLEDITARYLNVRIAAIPTPPQETLLWLSKLLHNIRRRLYCRRLPLRSPPLSNASLTVEEAKIVRQLSPNDRLLYERLHAIWIPLRGFHASDRSLGAHLSEVEVRRHVGAHVLVGIVRQVREPLQSVVDERLEILNRSLRSRREPRDLCRRKTRGTTVLLSWGQPQSKALSTINCSQRRPR